MGKAKPEYVKNDIGAITKVVYTENDGDSRVSILEKSTHKDLIISDSTS